jgi:hypothetical protein
MKTKTLKKKKKLKPLKKETEEDTRRCKELPYSWIGRISIMKIAILYY